MQPAGETEGDSKDRGAVGKDVAEAVVVDLLDRVARFVRDGVIYLSIASIMTFNSTKSVFKIFSPRLAARLTPVGPR